MRSAVSRHGVTAVPWPVGSPLIGEGVLPDREFLPQFVSPRDPHSVLHMLGLSAVFMVVTFVVFVGYGLFAASVRDHVISRPRVLTWLRRTFAGAFVALGARLATAER